MREGRKSCYIYSRCLIFIQVHVGLSQPHSRARLLSRTASDRKLGGAWDEARSVPHSLNATYEGRWSHYSERTRHYQSALDLGCQTRYLQVHTHSI